MMGILMFFLTVNHDLSYVRVLNTNLMHEFSLFI